MATKVDIAGTNISASQIAEFFRLASLDGHVNRESFQKYLEKKNPFQGGILSERYFINILPNFNISKMVELGNYNWASSDINDQNYTADQTLVGMWECKLIDPMGFITSEDALELCSADGWTPAKIDHLLFFGAHYPEMQIKNQIIALGSIAKWNSIRETVPLLSQYDNKRNLIVNNPGGHWVPSVRILCVKSPFS